MDKEKEIEEIVHIIEDVNEIYALEVDSDGFSDIGYSDRYNVNYNVAEALINAGYGNVKEYKKEIVDLTAKAEVLQSERDNLMRTVEEGKEMLEEARKEREKQVAQEFCYEIEQCGLDYCKLMRTLEDLTKNMAWRQWNEHL